MKTHPKIVRSSLLVALFTFLLMLGPVSSVRAQPAPLLVTNNNPCPIWVQGQTAMGLTPGCLTAGWVMIAPGTTGALMPCAGPTWAWYHVNYTISPPGGGGPIGMTNSPVAICGLAPVPIMSCTGVMFTPVWTGVANVTF